MPINLTWNVEDMALQTGHFDTFSGISLTLIAVVILLLGIIIHRAVFKLLKRLSGRYINQLIYPQLVSF